MSYFDLLVDKWLKFVRFGVSNDDLKGKIASFLASLRSGLYYIPLMLLLPNIIGILGVQSAQMWADLLAIITTIPFVISFFRTLPSDQILSKEK